MTKPHYLTAEGLERLKKELHRLTSVEREAAARAIAEARDKVICLKTQNTMRRKMHKVCLK